MLCIVKFDMSCNLTIEYSRWLPIGLNGYFCLVSFYDAQVFFFGVCHLYFPYCLNNLIFLNANKFGWLTTTLNEFYYLVSFYDSFLCIVSIIFFIVFVVWYFLMPKIWMIANVFEWIFLFSVILSFLHVKWNMFLTLFCLNFKWNISSLYLRQLYAQERKHM